MSLFDVYIVDVCGTLVHDDTTIGLLRYHFDRVDKRRWRTPMLLLLTAKLSPFRLGVAVIEKLSGRHVLKHLLVRMLRGELASDLDVSARMYAEFLCAHRRVPAVWARIADGLAVGRVVFASASLEPVVAALGAALGARYVASTLGSNDGVLTGHFASDLTERKVAALTAKFGDAVFRGKTFAITDNLTDRALLERATEACVVLHHPAHRERWGELEATFLGER